VKALFYLLIGYILGYLTFAFLIGGAEEVVRQVEWGIGQIQAGFDAMILWIQNYTPDQNPVE